MVNFLDGLPQAGAADALAAFSGPERLQLEADHNCVDYAEGVARSRLTPAFLDKAVQVPATGRSWSTTNKMLDTGAGIRSPDRFGPTPGQRGAQAGLDRV
jgi:hypothetical protein